MHLIYFKMHMKDGQKCLYPKLIISNILLRIVIIIIASLSYKHQPTCICIILRNNEYIYSINSITGLNMKEILSNFNRNG